jgi:hypothetical protein
MRARCGRAWGGFAEIDHPDLENGLVGAKVQENAYGSMWTASEGIVGKQGGWTYPPDESGRFVRSRIPHASDFISVIRGAVWSASVPTK